MWCFFQHAHQFHRSKWSSCSWCSYHLKSEQQSKKTGLFFWYTSMYRSETTRSWDCATNLHIWLNSYRAEMLNFVWRGRKLSTHLHRSELSCFDKPHMQTQSLHYWKTATFMVNYNLPPPKRKKKTEKENLTMKHQLDQYKCNCFPLEDRCHTRFAADLFAECLLHDGNLFCG